MAKSAIEKMNTPDAIKIVDRLPERVAHWGPPGASMLIATPREVEAQVKAIPKGKLATVNSLRAGLSYKHQTTIACPITTGIFMTTVARASFEMESLGIKGSAPWWRVLKSDGTLNEKYPGGIAEQKKRLEAEGHTIVPRGKSKLMVENFEKQVKALKPA